MNERGITWSERFAPTLADFEALAAEAWTRIPASFRKLCGDVQIRIEEFPTEDVLQSLGIESPFDLMGLYQGISLGKKGAGETGALPDMVFLYRRPILDVWAEGEDPLGHLVAHVLIHEIGHHFGLSDEDMQAIEDSVREGAS
jgi:predicted Zn-dependent protease with MMP-like domain